MDKVCQLVVYPCAAHGQALTPMSDPRATRGRPIGQTSKPMGDPCVIHGFLLLVDGSLMHHPWVGSAGPWEALY